MLRRTCGILCSDTSIFEVLSCHINNFSSFTLINVWWREFDFSIYLNKFLSVRPQYIRSIMTMRLCIFCQHFCVFFRIIFIFSRNFRIFYFAKNFALFFSPFFAKIFAFSNSRKFSHFSRVNEMRKKRFYLFAGNPKQPTPTLYYKILKIYLWGRKKK